MRMMF